MVTQFSLFWVLLLLLWKFFLFLLSMPNQVKKKKLKVFFLLSMFVLWFEFIITQITVHDELK